MKALKQAMAEFNDAERKYRKAIAKELPIGRVASYSHGDYRVRVEIVDHSGYSPKVRVRSLVSQKEYWVEASRFL